MQAHLHQTAAEVQQDHIGTAGGGVLVEGDDALDVRDRVEQSVVACRRPCSLGHRGQPEAARVQSLGRGGVDQVEVVGQPERGAHHPFQRLRRQVQPRTAAAQRLGQPGEVGGQLAADPQLGRAAPALTDLGLRGLPVGGAAQHLALDVGGDHVAGAAEVLPDLVDLPDGDAEELQLVFEGALRRVLPAVRDEVEDIHLRRRLAVPVDAAVALFQPVRVPGDLPVQQPVAVVLKVDALAGRVGGEQDPHRVEVRGIAEDLADAVALVVVHTAVEAGDPLGGVTGADEPVTQPALGVAIFGEDDDPLVVPLPAGADDRVEPVAHSVELRVGPQARVLRPVAQLLQQFLLPGGQRRQQAAGRRQGGRLGLAVRGVVLGGLLQPTHQRPEHALPGTGGQRHLAVLAPEHGGQMLVDRGGEGVRG